MVGSLMVRTVARYALEPFVADAIIARPMMHCQLAHGTSHSVSISM